MLDPEFNKCHMSAQSLSNADNLFHPSCDPGFHKAVHLPGTPAGHEFLTFFTTGCDG